MICAIEQFFDDNLLKDLKYNPTFVIYMYTGVYAYTPPYDLIYSTANIV